MIYNAVSESDDIRQGDIFRRVPRIDISLEAISVLARDAREDSFTPVLMSWAEAIEDEEVAESATPAANSRAVLVRAILPVCSVDAIVITQDCDAARACVLSLCEIVPLKIVHKDSANWTSPDKWQKLLSRQDTEALKWFYLPPDATVGFTERMAVDFRSIVRLPQQNLNDLRKFRSGRLGDVAFQHFREKIAHFFRRYAYDPWYALNREEFQAYAKNQGEAIAPFPWQKDP